ncbi:hypothetical protein [Streptomyces lavendulae]|uniref:hypothetical protein n=1 Tax=Streptomyces lavendulae TaxID=1914 RepID=UPI0031E86352
METHRLASGRTLPGEGWRQGQDTGIIFIDVDTSAAGFTEVPAYDVSVSGLSLVANLGCPGIYGASATGFTVGIRWVFPTNTTPLRPADAARNGFSVNWTACLPTPQGKTGAGEDDYTVGPFVLDALTSISTRVTSLEFLPPKVPGGAGPTGGDLTVTPVADGATAIGSWLLMPPNGAGDNKIGVATCVTRVTQPDGAYQTVFTVTNPRRDPNDMARPTRVYQLVGVCQTTFTPKVSPGAEQGPSRTGVVGAYQGDRH